MAIESPHFSLPLRFDSGLQQFVVTEQDTEDELRDCVELIVRYTEGDRPEKPEFGLPDQTFAMPTPDEDLIREAIARWEERIGTNIGHAVLDKLNPLLQQISVEVVNE